MRQRNFSGEMLKYYLLWTNNTYWFRGWERERAKKINNRIIHDYDLLRENEQRVRQILMSKSLLISLLHLYPSGPVAMDHLYTCFQKVVLKVKLNYEYNSPKEMSELKWFGENFFACEYNTLNQNSVTTGYIYMLGLGLWRSWRVKKCSGSLWCHRHDI